MRRFRLIPALLFAFLISPPVARAQGIAFESGDWQSVVAKAKAKNKLIFLDTYTTWCGPCKWMDKNVYPDAKVGERFNAAFVNYKIDAEKGEGIELAKTYQVTAYPTYLFVAPDESLVYRTMGSRPVEKFIEEADKAVEAGKGKPLSAYSAEYAAGKRDVAFLQAYLLKKKSLGDNDSNLLDEYLRALPIDSVMTSPTLELITDMQNPPMAGTKAFEVLESLPTATGVKAVYKQRVPYALERSIQQSARRAGRDEDPELLAQTLAANERVLRNKPGEVARQNAWLTMNYYSATKEKEAYAAATTKFVEKYLDRTNVDSLRQKQKSEYDRMIAPFRTGQRDSTAAENKQLYTWIQTMVRMAGTTDLAHFYNNAAKGFHQLVTDKTQLEKALDWSRRSLELKRTSAFLDTYAHLLYKLGRQQEALKFQQEAVALEKSTIANGEPGDAKALEETLEKMKKRTL